LGRGTRKYFSRSFKLGTVRLLEALPPYDPPTPANLAASEGWVRDFLIREVLPALQPAHREATGLAANESPPRLVGTGGTTAILARLEKRMTNYDRARIEGTRLRREQVGAHLNRAWNLSLAERRKLPGLPPERADVILTGLAIYAGVMDVFAIPELQVSMRGLRFAAVLD
jgi:exopolyphosphatase/guanosine-5'-triphosphate,3'-diphosphate pyrophosphatase